jgi:hypothetical protein
MQWFEAKQSKLPFVRKLRSELKHTVRVVIAGGYTTLLGLNSDHHRGPWLTEQVKHYKVGRITEIDPPPEGNIKRMPCGVEIQRPPQSTSSRPYSVHRARCKSCRAATGNGQTPPPSASVTASVTEESVRARKTRELDEEAARAEVINMAAPVEAVATTLDTLVADLDRAFATAMKIAEDADAALEAVKTVASLEKRLATVRFVEDGGASHWLSAYVGRRDAPKAFTDRLLADSVAGITSRWEIETEVREEKGYSNTYVLAARSLAEDSAPAPAPAPSSNAPGVTAESLRIVRSVGVKTAGEILASRAAGMTLADIVYELRVLTDAAASLVLNEPIEPIEPDGDGPEPKSKEPEPAPETAGLFDEESF